MKRAETLVRSVVLALCAFASVAYLSSGQAIASPAATGAASPAIEACAGGWMGLKSPDGAYWVWTSCDGTPEEDLTLAFRMIDRVWAPMVALMGKPVADVGGDNGGGDAAIDFYLVPPATATAHKKRTIPALEAHEEGSFFSAEPLGKTCSGFLVLRRDHLKKNGFASNVAHETFHLFQGAHNCRMNATPPEGGPQEEFWFSEASAKWAETHFVRETSRTMVHEPLFVGLFQKSLKTTLSAGKPEIAPYAAYMWPLFMEQQKGASAVADAWKALAGKGNWSDFMQALDQVLPFQDHFPEFALRNLNLKLGGAIAPRYVNLDPGFPDGVPPNFITDEVLMGQQRKGPTRRFAQALVSLKAHYYHWQLAPDVGTLELDFSELAPGDGYDAQVLVRTNGEWELHRLGANGGTVTFCRPEEVYLVLSNPSPDPRQMVTGTLEVRALLEECQGWSGWLRFTASDGERSSSSTTDENASWNVSVQGLQPNGKPTPGRMAVRYLKVNERYVDSADCRNHIVTRTRASGTVPVEVRMTHDPSTGYSIWVIEHEKLPVSETQTSTCGRPEHRSSKEIWFISLGPEVAAKPDPRRPNQLKGSERRVFENGAIDMIHDLEWNLRRPK